MAQEAPLITGCLARCGIKVFQCVVAPPLSGKSRYVSELLRTEFPGNNQHTRITVNEDFGASLVLARWRQLRWIGTSDMPSRHVAVHWNVPEFAPFGSFNNFLFGLCLAGMLTDEVTGETVFVPRKEALQWSFYAELASDRPEVPADARGAAKVPLLALFARDVRVIEPDNPPYYLDDDACLVSAFLQLYELGTLCTGISQLQNVTPLRDVALCRSLLNAAWGVGAHAHGNRVWQSLGRVPRQRARQEMSVKLLAVRIRWLQQGYIPWKSSVRPHSVP